MCKFWDEGDLVQGHLGQGYIPNGMRLWSKGKRTVSLKGGSTPVQSKVREGPVIWN